MSEGRARAQPAAIASATPGEASAPPNESGCDHDPQRAVAHFALSALRRSW